jgi:hypothetical protein
VPRAVTALDTGPGFAEYQLGQIERFTPLAFSCHLQNDAVSPIYWCFLQWRDATNYPIHTQYVGEFQTHSASVSFADGTEPWLAPASGSQTWPQHENYFLHSFVGQRFPLVPLEPRCSFGIYMTAPGAVPNNYPIGLLEPKGSIDAPHLWVQDSSAGKRLPPIPAPLLTHVNV